MNLLLHAPQMVKHIPGRQPAATQNISTQLIRTVQNPPKNLMAATATKAAGKLMTMGIVTNAEICTTHIAKRGYAD